MIPYRHKHLSLSEQDALAVRAQQGDTAARNTLIESVLPVIAKRVSNISTVREDRQDYVQEAAVHLFNTIARFDPARGHFLTLALRWADGGRCIWRRRQGWKRGYVGLAFCSLDAPVGEDRTLADTIAADADESVERESTRAAVREAIRFAGLTVQERELLRLAMGEEFAAGFQTRAAKRMGLSRQRVGQLWLGGKYGGLLGKLRTALEPLALEVA